MTTANPYIFGNPEVDRQRLMTHYFEWESKADRMLEIYRETIGQC